VRVCARACFILHVVYVYACTLFSSAEKAASGGNDFKMFAAPFPRSLLLRLLSVAIARSFLSRSTLRAPSVYQLESSSSFFSSLSSRSYTDRDKYMSHRRLLSTNAVSMDSNRALLYAYPDHRTVLSLRITLTASRHR